MDESNALVAGNKYLDPNLAVEGKKKGPGNRMYKFALTDGVNLFYAIEHENFSGKIALNVNNKCFLNPNPPI